MKYEKHCYTDYLDSSYFSKAGFISVYIILCNYMLCFTQGYQAKEHNSLIYKGELIKEKAGI